MNILVPGGGALTGTLAGTAPFAVVPAPGGQPPYCLSQHSASHAASIAISVSVDGVNFVPVPATATSATTTIAQWEGPAAQFQFAGSSGDLWAVM